MSSTGTSSLGSNDPLLRLAFDADSAKPIWRQLHEQIQQLITLEQLSPGDSLPSERDLSERLGLSRSTVKRCYDEMRNQRQLGGRGRSGSTIQNPVKIEPELGRLKGFTQEMRELGKVASTRLQLREMTTDRKIASLFDKPSNTLFLHLVRVRLGDGIPMTREVAWYDLDAVPALAQWDGEGSAYEFIKRIGGVNLTWADQSCEAVLSSAEENQSFGFSSAQPCLLFKRKSYAAHKQLVEYVEGTFRGDMYVYHLRLST
jgi:GntR family transcriptional regulator